MQRKQEVCASTAWRFVFAGVLLALLVLGGTTIVSAQVNTATLSGTVFDPQNLTVKGAKVTLTNAATGAIRTALTDDGGRYSLVGIPPGQYRSYHARPEQFRPHQEFRHHEMMRHQSRSYQRERGVVVASPRGGGGVHGGGEHGGGGRGHGKWR